MRPYSTKAILRRKAYAKVSCHRDLPVLAFLETRGDKSKYPHNRDSQAKTPVDSWKRLPVELSPVNDADVSGL